MHTQGKGYGRDGWSKLKLMGANCWELLTSGIAFSQPFKATALETTLADAHVLATNTTHTDSEKQRAWTRLPLRIQDRGDKKRHPAVRTGSYSSPAGRSLGRGSDQRWLGCMGGMQPGSKPGGPLV